SDYVVQCNSCLILVSTFSIYFFFFFQAEDGIRDGHVTGVQTCALPIFPFDQLACQPAQFLRREGKADFEKIGAARQPFEMLRPRSEERRVGKECRSRWSPYH